MPQERFTTIGHQIGPLYGMFLVAGIVGLIVAFFSKNLRWTGISVAICSSISLLFRVPSPYCLILFIVMLGGGRIGDIAAMRVKDPGTLRKMIIRWLFIAAMYVWIYMMLIGRKEITLDNNGILSTATFHKPFTAKRAEVRALELIGWDGTIVEWRFLNLKKGSDDPFLANMLYSELYWDHSGHVLTGKQVAAHVAAWSGIKFHRESYDAQFTSEH